MASVFSHAVAALGIGACFYKPEIPKRVWMVGAICAAIPDADVIGFSFGIHYGDSWGHRAFTHSPAFAAMLATAVVFVGFRHVGPDIGRLTQKSAWLMLHRIRLALQDESFGMVSGEVEVDETFIGGAARFMHKS